MLVILKVSSCVYVPISLVFSSTAVVQRMSQWFYAVGRGRQVGVYTSWAECQKQVQNISNAKFRKFKSHTEAAAFIEECKKKYSPYKLPSETQLSRDTINFPSERLCRPVGRDNLATCSQPCSTHPTKPILNHKLYHSQNSISSNSSEFMASSQRPNKNSVGDVSNFHDTDRAISPQTLSALASLAEDDPFLLESLENNTQNKSATNSAEVTGINKLMERIENHFIDVKITLNRVLLKINNLENKVQELSDQNTARNQCVENQSASTSGVKRRLLENYNVPQPVGSRHFSTIQEEDRDVEIIPVPPKKIPKIEVNSDDETDGYNYDFKVDENGYVIVFTDGACERNGRNGAKAGIGVWFGDCHPLNCSEPVRGGHPTNNTAEIQAAVRALQQAKQAGVKKIVVHTDSEFTINCITKWIHKWVKNNWKVSSGGNVKNKEDLIRLHEAIGGMDVKWEHVRGHQGIHGNEMADRLARSGAEKYTPT